MSPEQTASTMAEKDVEHPVDIPVAITAEIEQKYGIKAHWKCLAACTLVSMCPFQYGLDFGLIGGLQAMLGFLKVNTLSLLAFITILTMSRSSATQPLTSSAAGTSPPAANN